MAPSTLDLFVLTFNCAKNLINVGVFASHLEGALQQNATGLPELVVFSLQEIAPLSYSFIGGYFLSPYLSRFEEALNLAATRFEAQHQDGAAPRPGQDDTDDTNEPITVEPTTPSAHAANTNSPVRPYTLIRTRNVGMTAVMLFARDPAAVKSVQEAEVGFGAAEMGNKGAVGLRVVYGPENAGVAGSDAAFDSDLDSDFESTGLDEGEGKGAEVTFVATHLAAMEWNLARRNANWAAIMRGLTFENPEAVMDPSVRRQREAEGSNLPTAEGSREAEAEAEEERERLLPGSSPLHGDHGRGNRHGDEDQDDHDASLQAQLHDISVFKPGAHLFVAGDLNYRISSRAPPPLADFPSLDPESEHYYPRFFPLDQLTKERRAGRTFHGMSEAEVAFPPTYKYDVLPVLKSGRLAVAKDEDGDDDEGAAEAEIEQVPWVFAPHRYPSWTDRVLFLDGLGGRSGRVAVEAYDALPVVRTSDHRPVFLRANVPLLSRRETAAAAAAAAGSVDGVISSHADPTAAPPAGSLAVNGPPEKGVDPRVRLPVAIDPEAWERRAAARRREVFAGWSMFFWSTKEGALVIATVVALGVGSWWLVRGW